MAVTINADNGVSSGSAGLKQTADSTGVLALQTNGTTAVSISTGQVVTLTNALPVASGGTGATTNAGAAFALKGANSDITSLSGLTTALSVAQGGTGATTNAGTAFALKGANSDITSLSGLTTPLSVAQGGTGTSSGVIGSGQTWTDVTASRAGGTTYTNSTGKPILVIITVNQAASFVVDYTITVAGVAISRVNALTTGQQTTAYIPTTVIVPNGSTYLLTITTGVLFRWSELR